MPKKRKLEIPEEVDAIRRQLDVALNSPSIEGDKVGNAKFGVYAFYDYDGEPIYVGQTSERLRARVKRHLTNQRTDAIAMNVLDPFEVAEIELWPFFEWASRKASDHDVKADLDSAENAVFSKVLEGSSYHAVLNEKQVPVAKNQINLPQSYRFKIVPDSVFNLRKHSDIRIARRAQTIAALARVISERQVSKGLRHTLLTQARRLEHLAHIRYNETEGDITDELPGESESNPLN